MCKLNEKDHPEKKNLWEEQEEAAGSLKYIIISSDIIHSKTSQNYENLIMSDRKKTAHRECCTTKKDVYEY